MKAISFIVLHIFLKIFSSVCLLSGLLEPGVSIKTIESKFFTSISNVAGSEPFASSNKSIYVNLFF